VTRDTLKKKRKKDTSYENEEGFPDFEKGNEKTVGGGGKQARGFLNSVQKKQGLRPGRKNKGG